MRIIKNLLLFVILIAVIIGSFWLSFNIGRNLLMPATNKLPSTNDVLSIEDDVLKRIGEITIEIEALTQDMEKQPDYMKPRIAETRRKPVVEQPKPAAAPAVRYTHKVQAGVFSSSKNAQALVQKLKRNGFGNAYVERSGRHHRVCVRARSLADANSIARRMKAKGFEAFVRRN